MGLMGTMGEFVDWERRPEAAVLSRMRELLEYRDVGHGALIWRHGRLRGELAGSEVGPGPELRVRVEGKSYLAGKIAIWLGLGYWPVGRIRFVNGDRTDIRLENLEETQRVDGPGR